MKGLCFLFLGKWFMEVRKDIALCCYLKCCSIYHYEIWPKQAITKFLSTGVEMDWSHQEKTKLNILTEQDAFFPSAQNCAKVYIMKWDYRIIVGLSSASGKGSHWHDYRISQANTGHVGQSDFCVKLGQELPALHANAIWLLPDCKWSQNSLLQCLPLNSIAS